ncbi:MAG: hypothetical protein BWY88_00779 [Synergistetes bacterium ADurb.Bin520]|nr:MAG: hypothetical protein BWY88_00779 [Synergistetes bacterium ADurb.Bin520]
MDTYHRGNFRGNGTRHNVNHWGCNDKEWRVVMPLARRLHYYLTADPWTREVILNTVSAWQTYERTASSAPSITSALSGILVKHELTNDPADEAVLRRMADLYARAVRPDGHFVKSVHVNLATGEGDPVEDGQTMDGRYFFLNLFGGQHALVELAELLDHRPLIEAAARFADRCIAEEAAANAYGRIISEVGVSMMLGGNIKWHTRTITTAISLETGKGEFALGIALGLVLLILAFAVNSVLSLARQRATI